MSAGLSFAGAASQPPGNLNSSQEELGKFSLRRSRVSAPRQLGAISGLCKNPGMWRTLFLVPKKCQEALPRDSCEWHCWLGTWPSRVGQLLWGSLSLERDFNVTWVGSPAFGIQTAQTRRMQPPLPAQHFLVLHVPLLFAKGLIKAERTFNKSLPQAVCRWDRGIQHCPLTCWGSCITPCSRQHRSRTLR